ncbi:MAG: chitobiase/beta-hexosaminidase C-terminal domain-containing protein [Treponema sp.]|nr:chitobiase/beta-hexosaminidase C-terminal domain-containing protein [Treponema sp.]
MKSKKLFCVFTFSSFIVLLALSACSCRDIEYVSAPQADPPMGRVARGTTVTLKSATPEAVIWYSADGITVPAKGGPGDIYRAPITITAPVTIKAIATKTGMECSSVKEFTYTVY